MSAGILWNQASWRRVAQGLTQLVVDDDEDLRQQLVRAASTWVQLLSRAEMHLALELLLPAARDSSAVVRVLALEALALLGVVPAQAEHGEEEAGPEGKDRVAGGKEGGRSGEILEIGCPELLRLIAGDEGVCGVRETGRAVAMRTLSGLCWLAPPATLRRYAHEILSICVHSLQQTWTTSWHLLADDHVTLETNHGSEWGGKLGAWVDSMGLLGHGSSQYQREIVETARRLVEAAGKGTALLVCEQEFFGAGATDEHNAALDSLPHRLGWALVAALCFEHADGARNQTEGGLDGGGTGRIAKAGVNKPSKEDIRIGMALVRGLELAATAVKCAGMGEMLGGGGKLGRESNRAVGLMAVRLLQALTKVLLDCADEGRGDWKRAAKLWCCAILVLDTFDGGREGEEGGEGGLARKEDVRGEALLERTQELCSAVGLKHRVGEEVVLTLCGCGAGRIRNTREKAAGLRKPHRTGAGAGGGDWVLDVDSRGFRVFSALFYACESPGLWRQGWGRPCALWRCAQRVRAAAFGVVERALDRSVTRDAHVCIHHLYVNARVPVFMSHMQTQTKTQTHVLVRKQTRTCSQRCRFGAG